MNIPSFARQSLKFLPAAALLLAALLTVLPACRNAAETPTPPPAAQQPAPTASPRPLTPAERAAIAAFLTAQPTINEAQQKLRQDIDDWQTGLTACQPAAAQAALRDFAAASAAVTHQARNLPRGPRARELADTLISAAEAEAEAFRRLRDRWQPDSLSLFETVELRRSQSAAARNDAQDLMQELRQEYAEVPTPDEIAAMQQFAQDFAPIETTWTTFHQAYNTLEMEQSALGIDEIIARLNSLIAMAAAISESLQNLNPPDAAETLTQNLRQAITAEKSALENLTTLITYRTIPPPPPEPTPQPETTTPAPAAPGATPAPGAPGATPAPGAPGATPAPGAPGAPEPTPAPGAVQPTPTPAPGAAQPPPSPQAVLSALDAAITAAKAALDAANRTIQETVNDESAEILTSLTEFETAHNTLTAQWDAFHQEYSQWRQTDGGCDRIQTLTDLQQFAQRAAALSRQTRELPQTGPLLPIQTLLSDAAAREETALRSLHQTWRPFTNAPFTTLTQQQTAANNLTRQAQTALTQLQTRP